MSTVEARELERRIAGEVFAALGWSCRGPFRRALSGVISRPVRRFAEVAATCERLVAEEGLVAAARWTLSQFAVGLRAEGTERVPRVGPVLIVSNHPGGPDVLALAVSIGRDDLKIVAWPMPFLTYLPHLSRHLIYASDESPRRAGALREGIRCLRAGGALLLFARGRPEPDPATMRGAEAELAHWSRSIEILVRSVPEATVVPAIVSGVQARRFLRHPVTWVRRGRLQRQRLAMIVQFIHQMRGKRVPLVPRVTLGEPLPASALEGDPLPTIIESARGLLALHSRLSGLTGDKRRLAEQQHAVWYPKP